MMKKTMKMVMVMMMISPPGQNKDIVFNEGGVEPEVERTLLVVLWHLLRSITQAKGEVAKKRWYELFLVHQEYYMNNI